MMYVSPSHSDQINKHVCTKVFFFFFGNSMYAPKLPWGHMHEQPTNLIQGTQLLFNSLFADTKIHGTNITAQSCSLHPKMVQYTPMDREKCLSWDSCELSDRQTAHKGGTQYFHYPANSKYALTNLGRAAMAAWLGRTKQKADTRTQAHRPYQYTPGSILVTDWLSSAE